MTDDDTTGMELPRRKLLGGLGAVGVGSAAAGLGTSAFLTDTEAFTGNSLTAGTLDLTLRGFTAATNSAAIQATAETIDEQTADGSAKTIVNLSDVKPGDLALVCIEFEISGNPAYVQVNGDLLGNDENTVNEVEAEVDNNQQSSTAITGGGELAANLLIGGFGIFDAGNSSLANFGSGTLQTTLTQSDLDNATEHPAFDLDMDDNGLTHPLQTVGVSEITLLNAFSTGATPGGYYDPAAAGLGSLTPRVSGGGPSHYAGSGLALTTTSGTPRVFEPGTYRLYLGLGVPATTGNEIQSDAAEFGLTVQAEQARHNTTPFVDAAASFDGASGVDPDAEDGGALPLASAAFTGTTDALRVPGPIYDSMATGQQSNFEQISGTSNPTLYRPKTNPNAPRFVVGLHHPDVGSGNPTERNSLIGIRAFETGAYSSVGVRLLKTNPWASDDSLQSSGAEDISKIIARTNKPVTATLWHGPPPKLKAGPIISADGTAISSSAPVTFSSSDI